MRLGMIGYGAIGHAIVERLDVEGRLQDLAGILVRSDPADDPGVPIWHGVEALIAARPAVVIEAAGHAAVRDVGAAIVESGCDLVVAAVGALADGAIADTLRAAARVGGRVVIPAGAIAGLDGLVAARIAGLERVVYTSYKPPHAWRGTPAERAIDLDHRDDEVTFFTGTAREAASQYPQNANVAAAIALAGLGFEATEVRLVSSRNVADPLGVIEASGDFGEFRFEILAKASAANPKTSALTAYSLLQCARLGVGIPAFPESD
jgi:aspartate dehydrogenase